MRFEDGKRVFILLPVHNRKDLTLRFVECLKKQTHQNLVLILIDDGSKDDTSSYVSEIFKNLVLINGPGNWWWAGALEQGYLWLQKHAKIDSDYVLIMNDDTTFDENFVSNGLNFLAEKSGVLLTAKGYDINDMQPRDGGLYLMDWSKLEFSETSDTELANCSSTRGLLSTVKDFIEVGGFYPKLLPHYLSDLEFTMRAKENGKILLNHPAFNIGIDFSTTGIRELDTLSFSSYLKLLFSYRNAMNPLHWSVFVMLRSPWRYKFKNLYRVWATACHNGLKSLKRGFS